MYGIVNRAVEELVRSRFGDASWTAIRRRAGLDDEEFAGMTRYPDEVTYRLVGAASEELGVPPSAVLQTFGRFWVEHAARQPYGGLIRMAGRSVPEVLQHLDVMHSRVALTFPEVKAPSFYCTDVTGDELLLHYVSGREGLADFVVGLVHGLAEMFDSEADVEPRARKAEGADHDTFRVRIRRRAA